MITGNISGSGSNAALLAQITPESPRQSSLGSVVNDVLAALPDLASLVVCLAAGTVSVGATLASGGGAIYDKIVFSPVGTTRSLADWRSSADVQNDLTGFAVGSLTPSTAGTNDIGAMLAAVLDPEEVKFSVGSFIDALDREFQALSSPPAEVTIIVSQEDQTVTVDSRHAAPTGFDGTVVATFTRTAPTSPTAQWGE